MLRTLSEDERERFWVLLREVGDAAKLCWHAPAGRGARDEAGQ